MSGACSGTVQARLQLTRGARDGAAELWARSDSLQLCGRCSRGRALPEVRPPPSSPDPQTHLAGCVVVGGERRQRRTLARHAPAVHQGPNQSLAPARGLVFLALQILGPFLEKRVKDLQGLILENCF